MPSTRTKNFSPVTDESRQAPPASPGLTAPSAIVVRADKKHRRLHPGEPGPLSEERAEGVYGLILSLADKLSDLEIAERAGVSTNGRMVRDVIRDARSKLQRRVDFYLEAHAAATVAAAAEGNAKPAQWALERIAEGEDRVVDLPAKEAPAAPAQFNLGFVMGGIPMPATTPAVKAIEGEVVK